MNKPKGWPWTSFAFPLNYFKVIEYTSNIKEKLFTSFANDDKRERKLILHRNGFSNSPFPFNIVGITRFCFSFQYGLKILLCAIWNILQLSKNFNQFRRNLFVREWSRNYTSKSNSPSDKEKLNCNKDFLLSSQKRQSLFHFNQFFIRNENWFPQRRNGCRHESCSFSRPYIFLFSSRSSKISPMSSSMKWEQENKQIQTDNCSIRITV